MLRPKEDRLCYHKQRQDMKPRRDYRMWKKQMNTASVIGQMLKKDEHSRNCQKVYHNCGFFLACF